MIKELTIESIVLFDSGLQTEDKRSTRLAPSEILMEWDHVVGESTLSIDWSDFLVVNTYYPGPCKSWQGVPERLEFEGHSFLTYMYL